MAASDKDAYLLLSKYSSLYEKRYGIKPVLNKYKEKWGMNSIIEDFGVEGVKKTMDYFFRLNKEGHSLSWFYNNFSTIHLSRLAAEKDDKIRSAARQKTRQLRAEYLNGLS